LAGISPNRFSNGRSLTELLVGIVLRDGFGGSRGELLGFS
jgi:hypothetical protein